MAGPLTIRYLEARETSSCQCEPTLTFFVLLGATIFLAIVNVVGGLVFCVWRRAKAHRKETWGPDEKSRLSVADLALPRPPLAYTSPPVHQQPSDHLKVHVQVSQVDDARSEYGPPPRRRSATALLSKVLGGMKRVSQSSSKFGIPRSPASSTRSRRSPLDPPYPAMPTSPDVPVPSAEPALPAKKIVPKPRTVSLYLDKTHKSSASGNHLMPPQNATGSALDRGNSRRSNSGPAQSIMHASPTSTLHRPPPLPLTQDNRTSMATVRTVGVESPSSEGHGAPSALFTGVNAARVQSYLWPHSHASNSTAALAYDISTPPSYAPSPQLPSQGIAEVRRTSYVDPAMAPKKATRHPTVLRPGSSGGGVMSKLPSSPTTLAPIPVGGGTIPLSPGHFASPSPVYEAPQRQSRTPAVTTLTARRMSELPPPKFARSSLQSHRRSMSTSTISTVDYVSGVMNAAVSGDGEVTDKTNTLLSSSSLPSPTPPGLPAPSTPSSEPVTELTRAPDSATSWKKPHLRRPSTGMTGPRGPRSSGLR